MGELAHIPKMSRAAIEKVSRLESEVMTLPQVESRTDHVLHAGLYSRTIHIPAGVLLVGVKIKRATLLIACGKFEVSTGEETVLLEGYHVIPASAGRKQAFFAHEDTWLTMLFDSRAETVEQAENEFTDEGKRLMSRLYPHLNTITITGEL